MAVTRQPVRTRFAWQVAAVAIVAVVALDRWVTSAHWVSDLVGGVLFGGLVATVSLLLAGVHVPAAARLRHRDRPAAGAAAGPTTSPAGRPSSTTRPRSSTG